MPAVETPRLSLPLLAAGQSQKHVTHNEALMALDALVQLSVTSAGVNAPPASPTAGQRILIGAAPSGAFAGRAQQLAVFLDGVWTFKVPRIGWIAYFEAEAAFRNFDGTNWVPYGVAGVTNLLGINATASTTNRLAVASPGTLFNHEGAGHQLKLNKATAADTASLLFQDAFSGRAEIGACGNDDLTFKVSADGASWVEALMVSTAGRPRPAAPRSACRKAWRRSRQARSFR